MEAIASVAPGLCLGALSKVPIEIYKFLIEVPFAKEKSPCPFKYEVSGLHVRNCWLKKLKIWARRRSQQKPAMKALKNRNYHNKDTNMDEHIWS